VFRIEQKYGFRKQLLFKEDFWMKNNVFLIILLVVLSGCSKKGEDQVIGKWSFTGIYTDTVDGEEKQLPMVCNLELNKDSTYKENCRIDYKTDEIQGVLGVSVSGDWLFKKEEKSDGFFLMKPKERHEKVVSWQQNGMNFSELMLNEMNEKISLKEKTTADSEIKFTILSEKNNKLFIQINSSTEDEFPVGSFSMERYDDKTDKLKVLQDAKTSKNKVRPAENLPQNSSRQETKFSIWSETPIGTLYDAKNLKKEGDLRYYKSLLNFDEAAQVTGSSKKYWSEISDLVIDCNKRTLTHVMTYAFPEKMGGGEAVASYSPNLTIKLVPGAALEPDFDFFCAL
jgi:hypothetical protein